MRFHHFLFLFSDKSILNKAQNNLIKLCLLTKIKRWLAKTADIALRIGKQIKREMLIFSLILNLSGEQV